MTVKELCDLLEQLPDEMPVKIPIFLMDGEPVDDITAVLVHCTGAYALMSEVEEWLPEFLTLEEYLARKQRQDES